MWRGALLVTDAKLGGEPGCALIAMSGVEVVFGAAEAKNKYRISTGVGQVVPRPKRLVCRRTALIKPSWTVCGPQAKPQSEQRNWGTHTRVLLPNGNLETAPYSCTG